jgi:hypothetical protein
MFFFLSFYVLNEAQSLELELKVERFQEAGSGVHGTRKLISCIAVKDGFWVPSEVDICTSGSVCRGFWHGWSPCWTRWLFKFLHVEPGST